MGRAKQFRNRMDWLTRTADRFWSKVDRGEPEECWLWRGTHRTPNPCGLVYGDFGVSDEDRSLNLRAHRFAYTLAKGEIPDGMLVMHSCDEPLCVNPAHLFAGTNADNNRDCAEKGRSTYGERNPRVKLTEAQVHEILASDESCAALAEKYGVHNSAISNIRIGKKWSKVTGIEYMEKDRVPEERAVSGRREHDD